MCDEVEDETWREKKKIEEEEKKEQTYIELYNCSESLDNFLVSLWALQAVLKEEEDNIATLHPITTLEYIYFFFHRLVTMSSSPIFLHVCRPNSSLKTIPRLIWVPPPKKLMPVDLLAWNRNRSGSTETRNLTQNESYVRVFAGRLAERDVPQFSGFLVIFFSSWSR